MSGHLLPNATEHAFCCDIAFTDDSPASPKLLVQEAHMKIDVTTSDALVRFHKELCTIETQVRNLRESVQFVIEATTGPKITVLSPQEERQMAIRIAESVVSSLQGAMTSALRRDRFLREREVAEYMGINVATLRAWRLRRSKIGPPFTRLGRMILYSVTELEKHMAAHVIPRRE
jgi:DNA-binding transcriptional regulator YiaG